MYACIYYFVCSFNKKDQHDTKYLHAQYNSTIYIRDLFIQRVSVVCSFYSKIYYNKLSR